jgi:antitoxin (DNA-binding transcriptional repressor) of toxin-antitoxin stability system
VRFCSTVATRRYIPPMKAVAVRELKNHLSMYLRDVRAGEVVLVTDRGRVVAELRQPTSAVLPPSDIDLGLARLCAEGVLESGLPQDPRAYRSSPLQATVSSADLLEAERGRH